MSGLRAPLLATTLCTFLLIAGPALCDENREPAPRDDWRTVSGDMSPQAYRKAYRHNQRMVRDAVKAYSNGALRSAGVPETGIRLLGAAAGLAVDGDARLYLNRSKNKRLALEFRDVIDNDRGVVLGIRLKW